MLFCLVSKVVLLIGLIDTAFDHLRMYYFTYRCVVGTATTIVTITTVVAADSTAVI
jgi:hypothetical protein